MEFDDMPGDEMPEPFEDDLEEFERNQVAADNEGEQPGLDDDTALGNSIEESGKLLDPEGSRR